MRERDGQIKRTEVRSASSSTILYSPDITPSDYYLLPNLKIWLQGKIFHLSEEVKWEADDYFEQKKNTFEKCQIYF